MRIQKFALIFALILLLGMVAPVSAREASPVHSARPAAEDDITPPGDEVEPPDDDEAPTATHPIILMFQAYFGPQVGEEVLTYFQQGMGFGELVKLYAIAAMSQTDCAVPDDGVVEGAEGGDGEAPSCGVTVAELVAASQSGMGMGQLFKEYGKPSVLGVGHLRKGTVPPGQIEPGDDVDDGTGTGEEGNVTGAETGSGNGNGHGNGNGNGHGNGNGQGHNK
jgi:hypothetical protein